MLFSKVPYKSILSKNHRLIKKKYCLWPNFETLGTQFLELEWTIASYWMVVMSHDVIKNHDLLLANKVAGFPQLSINSWIFRPLPFSLTSNPILLPQFSENIKNQSIQFFSHQNYRIMHFSLFINHML